MRIHLVGLDLRALDWVAQRRRPALTRFFRVLTATGEGRAWFAAAGILCMLSLAGVRVVPLPELWLRLMLCPLAAWLVGIVLKRLVGRTRPLRSLADEASLGAIPRDGSFPSGHAAAATSFAVALALHGHPLALPVAVWAAFVSASRVYLGVHFPTDVLGGAVLGALVGAAGAAMVRGA